MPPPRWRRILSWVRKHPVKTVLLLIAAFLLYEIATIPWFSIGTLVTQNPGETALMRQRIRESEANGKKLAIRQSWVGLSRIPRHLQDAVIVAEDGTFYSHSGVDWFEVRESIEKNVKERRAARGGSTITQQLAKNLYLSTSKDPLRKAKEFIITLLLERRLSKSRILEIYLNVIEWGPGVFGADAAARTYFGKPAAALTLEESLRMAAVIPSPLRHRPDSNSRYVTRRKEIVRRRMMSRSFIPFDDEEEAAPVATDTARTVPVQVATEDSTAPADAVPATADSVGTGGAH